MYFRRGFGAFSSSRPFVIAGFIRPAPRQMGRPTRRASFYYIHSVRRLHENRELISTRAVEQKKKIPGSHELLPKSRV